MAKKNDAKAVKEAVDHLPPEVLTLAAAQGPSAARLAAEHELDVAAEDAVATPAEPTPAFAAEQPQPKDDMMNDMSNTMNMAKDAANAATDKVRALFFDKSGFADKTMLDGKAVMERTQRVAQDAAEMTRGNVEAIVASTRIATQNAGVIGQEAAELGRKSFEGVSTAMKSFAAAKTPAELFQLQSAFAKSSMQAIFAESARMGETVTKLMGEAMEPVSARFAEAAEKVKSQG